MNVETAKVGDEGIRAALKGLPAELDTDKVKNWYLCNTGPSVQQDTTTYAGARVITVPGEAVPSRKVATGSIEETQACGSNCKWLICER